MDQVYKELKNTSVLRVLKQVLNVFRLYDIDPVYRLPKIFGDEEAYFEYISGPGKELFDYTENAIMCGEMRVFFVGNSINAIKVYKTSRYSKTSDKITDYVTIFINQYMAKEDTLSTYSLLIAIINVYFIYFSRNHSSDPDEFTETKEKAQFAYAAVKILHELLSLIPGDFQYIDKVFSVGYDFDNIKPIYNYILNEENYNLDDIYRKVIVEQLREEEVE